MDSDHIFLRKYNTVRILSFSVSNCDSNVMKSSHMEVFFLNFINTLDCEGTIENTNVT